MQNSSIASALHLVEGDRATAEATRPIIRRYAQPGGSAETVPVAEVRGRRPADPRWLADANDMRELEISFDPSRGVLWQFMAPEGRPSFTEGLLREMTRALDITERAFAETPADESPPLRYLVLASHLPGVFNLGGNLALFQELIETRDWARLRRYAHICAHGQYRRADHLGLPITSIALVQGDALGGGFEAALAHDIIIAERQAKFGLPEVLFNMFPGMGAYSFLARRLDPAAAERLILSGRVYEAEELYELGVVDRLAEDGEGIEAVHACIESHDRQWKSRQAVQKARKLVQPLCLQEMLEIADLWVDTALTLEPGDLRRMQHLAKAQDRRWSRMWS